MAMMTPVNPSNKGQNSDSTTSETQSFDLVRTNSIQCQRTIEETFCNFRHQKKPNTSVIQSSFLNSDIGDHIAFKTKC